MSAATPVRSAAMRPPSTDDVHVDTYAAHLLDLLTACTDLSSGSDEVELACNGWHDTYHLSTSRANVLRALDVPADAIVLELGARAGAVTRHLGETTAAVDAIEPDPALAALAAHRCADLPSVAVHVGWIDEVPAEPCYDLIVAIDVLGEVQRRGGDLTSFVQRCRQLLTPTGVLVLGVDNTDGVRFVAGDAAPALEPLGRRVPRASRDELDDAMRAAGLTSTILGAFPDHRSARTVLDVDELGALDPGLLTALPNFPSAPYDGPRAADHAEQRLWSDAVAAGTGRESANGLVVVASAAGPAIAAAAIYWSMGRRAALSATNRILQSGDGPVVERRPTFPDLPPSEGPLHLRAYTEPLMRGVPLTQALSDSHDLDQVRGLLRAWSSLVDRTTSDELPVDWDLIPRNVLVLDNGELIAFDQEWVLEPTPAAADLIRRRGSFWLAYDLVTSRRPAWLPGATIGESADVLLRLAQPEAPANWLRTFFDHESIHMSHIWPTTARHTQPTRARRERNSVSSLSNMIPPEESGSAETADTSQTLRDVVESLSSANAELRAESEELRLEQRRMALNHRDHTVGLMAQNEALRDRLVRAQQESRRHKERAARLQTQLKALRESTSWRVGSRLVRPLAPLGRKRRR